MIMHLVCHRPFSLRKLRKNPETKEALGMELVSGRDIMNVAFVFMLPRSFNRKAKKSRAAFLFADADLLYKYTSRFDRIIGRVLYSFLLLTVIDILVLAYFFQK